MVNRNKDTDETQFIKIKVSSLIKNRYIKKTIRSKIFFVYNFVDLRMETKNNELKYKGFLVVEANCRQHLFTENDEVFISIK